MNLWGRHKQDVYAELTGKYSQRAPEVHAGTAVLHKEGRLDILLPGSDAERSWCVTGMTHIRAPHRGKEAPYWTLDPYMDIR